jgi:hypothetical protein
MPMTWDEWFSVGVVCMAVVAVVWVLFWSREER